MLKITYTDHKISLDCLKQSLEDWINARVLISIRSTFSIYIESSTASILVPASSSSGIEFISDENIVELCRCDRELFEVVLKGIWLTSEVESETGIFVTELEEYTECLLQNLFERELCTQA